MNATAAAAAKQSPRALTNDGTNELSNPPIFLCPRMGDKKGGEEEEEEENNGGTNFGARACLSLFLGLAGHASHVKEPPFLDCADK